MDVQSGTIIIMYLFSACVALDIHAYYAYILLGLVLTEHQQYKHNEGDQNTCEAVELNQLPEEFVYETVDTSQQPEGGDHVAITACAAYGAHKHARPLQ